MATFSQTLRTSSLSRLANIQRRQARLRGRPLTRNEAAAPFEALAATAGTRLAQQKGLKLQEEGLGLEERRITSTETIAEQNRKIERERLANIKEAEQARLAESQRVTDLELKAAEEAQEVTTSGRIVSGAVGAAGGAFAGGKVAALAGSTFGPLGTIIGGILGLGAGIVSGKFCIIVTVCTRRYSHEVNITREYRDKMLDPETLTGYYILASILVPILLRSIWARKVVKKLLVDRLVDHGEVELGYKTKYAHRLSKWVAGSFLRLCKGVARVMPRSLKEVYHG